MADYRFRIEKEVEPLNMKLNTPLFFVGHQYQLLKDEVIESQSMVLIKIHVERAIA